MKRIAEQALAYLACGVDNMTLHFDEETGRFVTADNGWATTHQDQIYSLALLALTPGSPFENDEKILNWCFRGGDALRDWQYEDGSFEFIKIDGSRWGPIYQPWTIYHWLEAYVLLREHLDSARRRRWEDGLLLAYQGLNRILAQPQAHNIPTWNGMSLVRGGQVFERDDWVQTGTAQILFTTAKQEADGFWPEGEGPTNGYNKVYVHALGLYHAFTGDRRVLSALRRAANYHAHFLYPDGSAVETIDGRQHYAGKAPSVMGWPGFSRTPLGRRLIRLQADVLFQPGHGGLDAWLAPAIKNLADGEEQPLPQETEKRMVFRRRALILRDDPWFVCVSGYSTPSGRRLVQAENRWIMTRSNNLSVWHQKRGLIIGGGNSKLAPAFATFAMERNGGLQLEPDAVAFSCRKGVEHIRFRYGDLFCRLSLQQLDESTLELIFSLPLKTRRTAHVTAHFTLFDMPEGEKLIWEAPEGDVYREETLDPRRSLAVAWSEQIPGLHQVRMPGWRLEMPEESAFSYPAYPFNPYAIDGAAAVTDAMGGIMVWFDASASQRFLLHVE